MTAFPTEDTGLSRLIAANVRRYRQDRAMSLGEVARRSGLSKQTLSKLEAGSGNPTVDTLTAVGRALDVPLRRLVTEWGSPVVVRRGADAGWRERDGAETLVLDEVYGTGHVRSMVIRLSKKRRTRVVEAHSPGTLHQFYVISGEVRTGPVSDPVDLAAGDFVRFPGDVPHRHTCLSDEASAYLVTTIPQTQQLGAWRAD